jgi:hypothetical protein
MSVNLSLFAGAGAQFFDNNGVPLAGGLIYTYLAGTTTPAVTYTSITGLIAHANPIVLNAAGRVPTGEIWLSDFVQYKFLLKDSLNVQIGSFDNIEGLNPSVFATNVIYEPVGAASTTVAAELDKINSAGIYGNNYIAAGQPADLNGFGKGGFKVGGGTPESTNGMFLSLDGASNWLVTQVSKNENPTESILYSTSAQGYATSVVGTNQITKVWGSDFQSTWVGNTIYFLRKKFKVVSVINVNNLTVSELDNTAVVFPLAETEAFNYFYTSGSGLCNVSGTSVTFVSGDPFVPLFFSDFKFTLNGVVNTVSAFVSPEEYTLATPSGNATNVPFTWQGNINDQITTIRVQAIQGENEENINLMSIAGDNFLGRYYTLNTGTAGTYGEYRPIFIGSGNYTDFSYQHQVGVYPRDYLGTGAQGYVALGGVQGREGFKVYSPNASTPLANRISTEGTAAGFAPYFKSEGSDTNIAFGIDTKGIGEFRVTQDFSRVLFKAQGGLTSVNWLTIGASPTGIATNIGVDPLSTDANVDIYIAPKGTGKVAFGNVSAASGGTIIGFIEVKDYAGTVHKIPTIV